MKKYKTIGILGGMGAEATVDLYMGIWKYFQDNFNAKFDDEFPPVIIYSIPIPDVVKSLENKKITTKMLQDAARSLEKSGCDFIVIVCNSVQFLLSEIRQTVKIPIIGIAEVSIRSLKNKKIRRVGILSTSITIEKQIYERELKKIGICLIKPTKKEQEIITKTIMTQLAGQTTKKETEKLIKIAENLKSKGAETVLLACTDLPLIINQKDTEIPLINCTEIYANEIAQISANKIKLV